MLKVVVMLNKLLKFCAIAFFSPEPGQMANMIAVEQIISVNSPVMIESGHAARARENVRE